MSSGERSGKGFIILMVVLIILLLGLIGYKFYFINIEVDGDSMNPTLVNGNELVVNKLALPDYNDIAVFNIEERANAEGKEHYWIIKRVIGKEGDKIKIENGIVYRQSPTDSEYVFVENAGFETIGRTDVDSVNQKDEWEVGKDEYFFLGDNRINSWDSRHYGLRNKEDLVGVVTTWSLEKEGFWYGFHSVVNYPSTWFSSCTNRGE